MKKGINLDVSFKSVKEDEKDGDMDVEIKIAPNTEKKNVKIDGAKEGVTQRSYSISPKRRRHILEGDPSGTGHGPNRGQTEGVFPDTWTDDQVINAIERIASGENSSWKQANGPGYLSAKITKGGYDNNAPKKTKKDRPTRFKVQGNDHGLKIEVIVEPNGEGVITGYIIG